MRKINEVEIAWLAGLIEGEGAIGVYKYKTGKNKQYTYDRPLLQLTSTDIETIATCLRITGIGGVYYSPSSPSRLGKKDAWKWQVDSFKKLKPLLRLLFPYLSCKRERAAQVLSYQKVGVCY